MKKRAHNFIDLSGNKINMLTILKPVEYRGGIKWECVCDCGNKTLVSPPKLKSGHTKSCGCLSSLMAKERKTTHGYSGSLLSGARNTMVQRCHNKNSTMYYAYGARGISVCIEWRDNPSSFYKWAEENGYKKGLTIDRIDNDGNYEPTNCRWVTLKENIAKEAKVGKSDRVDIINLYLDKKIFVKDIASLYDIDITRIYQILKEEGIKVSRRIKKC